MLDELIEQNEPKKEYRGSWIPPQLMEAVEKEEISIKEAWLLMVIDAFTRTGKGCFASNEYLAKKIQTENWQARKYIRDLIKRKWLTRSIIEGKRFLILIWDHVWGVDKSTGGCCFINREGVDKSTGIDTSIIKDPTHILFEQAKTACVEQTVENLNSITDVKLTERQKARNHPRWKSFTSKLYAAIKELHKCEKSTTRLNQWTNQFFLLHYTDKIEVSRIRTVLDWYVSVLPLKEKYMPEAHCGTTFREKFYKLEKKYQTSQNNTSSQKQEEEEDPWYLGKMVDEKGNEIPMIHRQYNGRPVDKYGHYLDEDYNGNRINPPIGNPEKDEDWKLRRQGLK